MKNLILFLGMCLLISCKPKLKETFQPMVYIIAGKSDTFKWGLRKSQELIRLMDINKEHTLFTHESMYNDIKDGEWNGLYENNYVSFHITDDRQLQPEIQEYYDYIHSNQARVDSNKILTIYSRLCKVLETDVVVPVWENPKIGIIKKNIHENILKNSHLLYRRKVSLFMARPDAKIIELVTESQVNNHNLIVRYDYAHALKLVYHLKKQGIKYQFYNPTGVNVKKKYVLLINLSL